MLDPRFVQMGNTLIAQLLEKIDEDYYRLLPEIIKAEGYGIAKIENMKFHQSWDWLIPIIQKMDLSIIYFDFDIEKCYENVVFELQERLRT